MVKKTSFSTQIYVSLVILLACLTGLNLFLPQGSFLPEIPSNAPPKIVLAFISALSTLIVYGSLGFIGLKLSSKLGFPELWESKLSNQQRLAIPALAGVSLGIFFIVADLIFQQFHDLSGFPHPPFPTSIVASINAAIGEEIIFRLFLIPFGVWLISNMILKGRRQSSIFWFMATVSAVAFALGHLPIAMQIFDLEAISEIPVAIITEMLLLNGILSFLAAYYLKQFGFLAAVSLHFWTDVVWHVIWGLVS